MGPKYYLINSAVGRAAAFEETALPTRRVHPLAILLARRACLWAAFCLASLLTTATHPACAAVTEAWVHRYSNVLSNANNQAVKVVRDVAGDASSNTWTPMHPPSPLSTARARHEPRR